MASTATAFSRNGFGAQPSVPGQTVVLRQAKAFAIWPIPTAPPVPRLELDQHELGFPGKLSNLLALHTFKPKIPVEEGTFSGAFIIPQPFANGCDEPHNEL